MCRQNKGWKSLSSRLDRGKNIHLSTDHVDILDVSIEGCTDERLSLSDSIVRKYEQRSMCLWMGTLSIRIYCMRIKM
jgi:hypothetical protein